MEIGSRSNSTLDETIDRIFRHFRRTFGAKITDRSIILAQEYCAP